MKPTEKQIKYTKYLAQRMCQEMPKEFTKEAYSDTIYTEWEGRDEETNLIADTLTLRNPFEYGEDAIEINFSVNGNDYLKLKQFCVAKGIFPENWVKDNPCLQEDEKSIDTIVKTEFYNNHKADKEM